MKLTISQRHTITSIICFFLTLSVSDAQITFKQVERFADLDVKIGKDVSFPDVTVKIGKKVSFEDITVGLTNDRKKANFIISDDGDAKLQIKAGENVTFPDLSIKAGPDASFPDITVKIKDEGVVDYIVFIDKDLPTINDVVIALLPAINKHLDYKLEKIPKIK